VHKRCGRSVTTRTPDRRPTAATVRFRDGKALITDCPFAETREQLDGYFLGDAKDLDEAIDIARQIPGGRLGTVEIRPVLEVEEYQKFKASNWIVRTLHEGMQRVIPQAERVGRTIWRSFLGWAHSRAPLHPQAVPELRRFAGISRGTHPLCTHSSTSMKIA
jgi:hypothetical protein